MPKLPRWIRDWIGGSDVIRRTDRKITPMNALQNAGGILALAFAQPILAWLLDNDSAQVVLVARFIILAALVAMAHYVVISKCEAPPDETTPRLAGVGTTPKLAYVYSEGDRLTSKLVVILGLALLVYLSWPKVSTCYLSVQIQPPPGVSVTSFRGMSLDVAGADYSNQFLLSATGTAHIVIEPPQVSAWTLGLHDADGQRLTGIELKGCIDAQQRDTSADNWTFSFAPR
ncbi:hypothetical protein ACQUQP_06960 [Marinobacterium sp. YM272]|uniref:hypothetical protein n=1 Tax=Marinobacterium sp. YM272 TaxID=3421654 RepID=UPI003D7F9318